MINENALKNIYCTIEHLESNCNKADLCWKGWECYKPKEEQTPHLPSFGKEYNTNKVLFCGINLNGGNNNIYCLQGLTEKAVLDYIIKNKHLIRQSRKLL